MEIPSRTQFAIQGRSEGDGMENNTFHENDHKLLKSPIINYPTNFNSSGKKKEPKFVPYEPYKAATSPIVAKTNKFEKSLNPNCIIDSQKVESLASSVIKLDSCNKIHKSLKSVNPPSNGTESKKECSFECLKKINVLEDKILALEKEKEDLESQFRIQTEVNADLKKMLIASLGEDMELKVSYMTQDKARLGMNVLQFSEELRQKNEEIDRLAVQSDVWKCKFEASSVMVDDLAVWKKALTQKLNESVRSLNLLLKEHEAMFDQLHSCYSLLKHTQVAFNPGSHTNSKWNHVPQNLLTLIQEIQSLSNSIQDRLLGNYSVKAASVSYKGIRQLTPAENLAYQTLNTFDDSPFIKLDSSKVLKHGPGTTACEVLPHVCSTETTVNCCKHCSGDIKCV